MADNNKARVHIEVTGDASGAEEISKGLEKIRGAAIKLTDTEEERKKLYDDMRESDEAARAQYVENQKSLESQAVAVEKVTKVTKEQEKVVDAAAKNQTGALKEQAVEVDHLDAEYKKLLENINAESAAMAEATKNLDEVTASTKKTADSIGEGGGLTSRLQTLFPTFSKIGPLVQSFGKQLLGTLNPVQLATGAITAGVVLIVKAYRDVIRQEEQFAELAGKGWGKLDVAVKSAIPTVDSMTASLAHSASTIQSYQDRLTASEGAIQQRVKDQDALAASTTAVTLANIRLAESEGRLTKEEAARQSALTEAKTAEEAYARQQEAANQVLKERQRAAQGVAAELEKLKVAQAAIEGNIQAAESGTAIDRAAAIDPNLNANVRDAQKSQSIATGEASTTIFERASELQKKYEDTPFLERIFPPTAIKLALDLVNDYRDQTASINEAAKQAEQSGKDFEAAVAARTAALNQLSETNRKELEKINAAVAAAEAKLASTQAAADAAAANAAALAPGGVRAQIFSNQQQASAINTQASNVASGAGPVTASAAGITGGDLLSGIPESPSLNQLKALLADGLQERETGTVEAIVREIATFLRKKDAADKSKAVALENEVQKMKAQLADIRETR